MPTSFQAQNLLLKSISPESYEKLAAKMKLVSLKQGQILRCPQETIREVYFPLSCLLSITITMQNGSMAETGVIGNRDLLGINAFMGGQETTSTGYVVQVSGEALQLKAEQLREEFKRNQEIQSILLHYTQAYIAQVSQTTACNRLHVLEQRFARWLLECQDRLNSNTVALTQALIANMLGVRRAGVTQAAQMLQDQGIIKYSRGKIRILDQVGLQATACECFMVVKDEYDRLLKGHK